MATTTPAPAARTQAESLTALTAPSVTATAVDMTPEKGFFKAMWSKVVDVYTSTFKASERLERMSKMPSHHQEIVDATTNWRKFADNMDPAIRAHVKALGNSIGDMIEKSGDQFANAMKKLNSACEEITGFRVAELTPTHRRELSIEQRARLATAYADMKAELNSSKTPYIEAAKSVQDLGTIVTDLISVDSAQRAALNVYDKEAVVRAALQGLDIPKPKSTFGTTDLLDPMLQAVAPNIDQKIEALYSAARNNTFETLAQSEGVKTGVFDKIKEAIGAAKTALEDAGTFVRDVVKQAASIAEHLKKNEAIRNDILSGIAPTDRAKKVAYVSETTLSALKNWFTSSSQTTEASVRGTFEKADTEDQIKAWVADSEKFTVTSEQYRKTLQSLGDALAPLAPLIEQSQHAPELFKDTVAHVSIQIQMLAVHFVTTLPHDKAMEKLAKLAEISSKVAVKAEADLQSGGDMTEDERNQITGGVDQALADLKKSTTKGWI